MGRGGMSYTASVRLGNFIGQALVALLYAAILAFVGAPGWAIAGFSLLYWFTR